MCHVVDTVDGGRGEDLEGELKLGEPCPVLRGQRGQRHRLTEVHNGDTPTVGH